MRNKFKPGNPGKPKGAKNKSTVALRETINNFLSDNFNQIKIDFKKLPPRDRAKVFCDLLAYSLPKLQSTQLVSDFERMTDAELDKAIEELKNVALNNHEKQTREN